MELELDYEPREQQVQMSENVMNAFNEKYHLICEAPTGVGEPSTPPAGAALANAIVAAGQPLAAHLPMSQNGVNFS